MTPSLPVLLFGLLVVLGAPLVLHLVLASASSYTDPPVVVLLGPDNAGKTALATLLERGTEPARTHTSQATLTVELNASTDSASRTSFRNHADSSGTHTKFLLVDTPGHAKLRSIAMASLDGATRLRALVFMVDAAALAERETLAPTAAYLYDVLLHLQTKATAAKAKAPVPVLIAANKMDLFTALPATMVKSHLEKELSRIRASRSKGLLDSGVAVDDVGSQEHDAWLGEYGSEAFAFQQMREFNIDIDVVGASVTDQADVDKWWWWIAQRV